jgi:hypothetical protein
MQVRQLQIAHDALQDRLVLRVATQADEEFRVWLTRRFLSELWPHLAKLLGHAHSNAPLAADVDAIPTPPSFEQAFQDDKATYPLGSNPLLTSEIKVDTLADGSLHLTFREGRERSFELGLTPDLLQALCSMLRAAAEQAHWGLDLDYAVPDPSLTSTAKTFSHLH